MKANSRVLQDVVVFSGRTARHRKVQATNQEEFSAGEPAESGGGTPSPAPAAKLDECSRCAMRSSSCGDSEGRVMEKACPSSLSCTYCVEVLHELSNVMTGVLTNAQRLGWKLPPYSHLKRPVREMERNAERGGELLKRLMRQFAGEA